MSMFTIRIQCCSSPRRSLHNNIVIYIILCETIMHNVVCYYIYIAKVDFSNSWKTVAVEKHGKLYSASDVTRRYPK